MSTKRLPGKGQYRRFLVLTLEVGPLSGDAIFDRFLRLAANFGAGVPGAGTRRYRRLQGELDDGLSRLSELGLVVLDEHGNYRLTEHGFEEAARINRGMQRFTSLLQTLRDNRQLAPKISMAIHTLLAALKLGVGLLFNSVALVADGFDNMVDVVSAMAVLLGIKHGRQIYATAFIILVMFGTAIWIGSESIARLVDPEVVRTGPLIIAVAVMSGGVCYLLSVYQHVVGKTTGSLPLISQSIDSRNHVFYAAAVIIGLIFAIFDIFIVDSIVALAVAFIILKSAMGLAAETRKVARGEELNLSQFSRGYEKTYSRFQRRYLRSWTLFSLRDIHTEEGLINQFKSVFSMEGLPVISHFGFSLTKGFDFESEVESLLGEMTESGLVLTRDGDYYLTGKGEKELNRTLRPHMFT